MRLFGQAPALCEPAPVSPACLLDHLIRQQEQRWGHRHPERLGGLEVEDQLKFRGLLHRQVGRFGALEDLVHVGGGAVPALENVRPVVHESPGLGIPYLARHRRQVAGERQLCELCPVCSIR